MTVWLACALACVLSTWSVPVKGQQPAKLDTVRVSGRGATRWSARGDAIRQAMQQKVAQLVIADRAVSADSVLKDDVVSTMNGFVEGFEVIAERRSGEEIELDARVILGTGSIERYIARRRNPTAGMVDGDGMLARLQASQAFERARADVVTRLFSGFPGEAVSLTVDEVHPDPEDRSRFLVFGRSRVDDGFANQLTTGMDALLKDKCPRPDCEGEFILTLVESSGKTRQQVLRGIVGGGQSHLPERSRSAFGESPLLSGGFQKSLWDSRLADLYSSAIFFTEDAVAFVEPSSWEWMEKYPGSIDGNKWRRERDKALCEGMWYTTYSNGFCIAIGDRRFLAKVLPEFLEGAKTISGMLVPVDVSRVCELARQNGVMSSECAGELARLIGRRPRKVFFKQNRIPLTADLSTFKPR